MAQWFWTPDCLSELIADQNKGRHRDPALGRLFKYCRRISNRFPNKSPLHQTISGQTPVWIYSKTLYGLSNMDVFHFAVSQNTRLGLIWTPELTTALTRQEEQALLAEALKRLNDPSSPPMQ